MGLRDELYEMSKKAKETQWDFIPDLCRKAASEGKEALFLSRSKVPGCPPVQTLALYLGLDVELSTKHSSGMASEEYYRITWQPSSQNYEK